MQIYDALILQNYNSSSGSNLEKQQTQKMLKQPVFINLLFFFEIITNHMQSEFIIKKNRRDLSSA